MSKIRSIEYVAVELSPIDARCHDPETAPYVREYADFPEAYRTALDNVVAHLDSTQCVNCKDGVGYVLHEDDDYPERSRLKWHAVWLVRQDGGPVALLCEDCAPMEIS